MAAAAAASGTRWMRAAGWFSVAAAGQAAALQTISAGTAIRFQHYKSPAEIASLQHGLVLASFAIQTALVLMGLRGKWTVIGNWARRALKPWQMIAILAALAATAACMSRDVAFYSYETAFVLTVELVNLGNAVLIAWYVPDEALGRMEGYWDTLSQRRSIALGAAVWITCLTALLSFVVYERHPHIPDEVSYVYQARYLAAGMLTMPAVPALEPFRLDLMTYEPGRWYSPFPPGWPAMLAVRDPGPCGPKVKNIMLASSDQVAIDAVAAKLMGFDPLSIGYIRLAHERGLGIGDPRDIRVEGADIAGHNWQFSVGRNLASHVGSFCWFGPLKGIQKFLFHSPLVHLFVFGSEAYHDWFRWPVKDRRVFEQWRRDTPWGQLFDQYSHTQANEDVSPQTASAGH